MQVLLIGSPESLPDGLVPALVDRHWDVEAVDDIEAAAARAQQGEIDAVVVAGCGDLTPNYRRLLRSLDTQRIPALVVGGDHALEGVVEGTLIDLAGPDVSKEEVTRRLITLGRFHKQLRRIEGELERVQRLGSRLNQHFREIDDEMRLASRLQHDFLPLDVNAVGPLRFASIYRPASWVSGDMFDVQRIDETHVGFYVVDAVGHGLAAGLLTMFVKRAITTKRIDGSRYEIVPPGESLQLLNDALSQYALPNCQFVTAVYCLLDTESLVMRYARGGHPYPLLLREGGQVRELKSAGGLMGLFPGFDCPTEEVQLRVGDNLVLYTDGLEAALETAPQSNGQTFAGHRGVIESLGRSGVRDLVTQLNERLDREQGSLLPSDDVTVLAVEVLAPDSPAPRNTTSAEAPCAVS